MTPNNEKMKEFENYIKERNLNVISRCFSNEEDKR